MKSKACLAAAVAVVLLALSTLPYFVRAAGPATRGEGGAMGGEKPYLTLAGASSKIEEPTIARVTTAKEFQDLDLRHLGADPARFDEFYNPHGVPVIDFERCMVLAVFKGNTWNVAGVYVESVLDEGARRVVRVRRRGYQTAGPDGGGKRATPYGIFVLPRSNKELVVEEDVRTLKNEPPKWNEIARFTALRP